MFQILLVGHIISGTLTLLSSAVAITSKLADIRHDAHIWSGRAWMWGMTGIFVTGLGMSLIRVNPPMLFVSIFSFYFAWVGWRYAKNRRGEALPLDKVVTGIMTLVFAGMIAYGVYTNFVLSEPFGTVIIVFGVIGILNAYNDFKYARTGPPKGKQRIAEHLSRMLGGTIAAITAFFVVNLPPSLLVWLVPTIVLSPIIFIWSKKINSGIRRKGMQTE